MKKKIFYIMSVLMCVLAITPVSAAQNKNIAWSEEYFNGWWRYEGTAQFVPSYKIPSKPGYSLKEGKKVNQAYVNYTRRKNGSDQSIIGGRKYSKKATSQSTTAIYSVKANASDSWNIFTNQTRFWYGWSYF